MNHYKQSEVNNILTINIKINIYFFSCENLFVQENEADKKAIVQDFL